MTLVGSADGNYGVGGQQKTPTVDMVRVFGFMVFFGWLLSVGYSFTSSIRLDPSSSATHNVAPSWIISSVMRSLRMENASASDSASILPDEASVA